MEKVIILKDGYYLVVGSRDCVLEVKNGENFLYKRYSNDTYDLLLSDFLITPQLVQRLLACENPIKAVNY